MSTETTSSATTTPATHAVGSIGWFEIASANPDRAQAFYSSLFGWSVTPAGAVAGFDYRDISTGQGHPVRGGILGTDGKFPSYAIFVVVVDDVPAAIEKTTALGGSLVNGPITLDSGLVCAYLSDPDGSLFSVFTPPAA
jgi:uncharacterized protein